jgi:DNA polymerase III epsilon subunit-like protein
MRNKIANVLDLEFNNPETTKDIIEIGLAMVDLDSLTIVKKVSIPVLLPEGMEVNPFVSHLTGWTTAKLLKQGVSLETACERIKEKYGSKNRLLVVDDENETSLFKELNPFGSDTVNVSSLYKVVRKDFNSDKSLEFMLESFGLKFEGKQHRASDDAYNIAKLFITMMKMMQEN